MATLITQNDLLDALRTANAAPAEARTVNELAELTQWSAKRIREAIGHLAMQDRVATHRVPHRGIDGRNTHVPAYTILPAKPVKRK